jgi:glycosyltransferase involved in cell wall biosynthesis
MTPLVSIVTPSYNQAQFLETTIQSVLAQDYPAIEYIVVDGGSKDSSPEIIRRYADRLGWWVSEKDDGQSAAINKGFAHAHGEIFAWLNSDDIYHPGAISEAVAHLNSHPEAGMVYGDAALIDDQGRTFGKFASKQTDYLHMLRGSVHIPQATTFFRAGLWRQVGPLDASMFFAFDYNLWVHLAKVSELHYLPRLWADFRIHDQGKSIANDDRCYPEMLKVYQREGGGWLSWLRLRMVIRRVSYAWMPWRFRLWLRKAVTPTRLSPR